MKPYGVKRKDSGCCPGHDKFPRDKYGSARSRRARAKARLIAHKRARAQEAQTLSKESTQIATEAGKQE